MSWYSNILTRTTSQISSLRSTLLSSEQDGDTDDDTHVCRVLRNYYTDKGRAFPAWLPPDPKAPVVPQPVYANATSWQQQQIGARYGGLGPGGSAGGAGGAGGPGAGGLSSLWDSAPGGGGGPQQQQQQMSLRSGRGSRGGGLAAGRDDVQARPLPSQRAGSYQGVGVSGSPAGTASAQDRLKQRLWGGGRSASPLQGGSGPFQPPPGPGPASGGGASYEDRFAPGGSYGSAGEHGGGQRRQMPQGPRGYNR
ncbi:hypothetical protein E4U43_004165 [Claviceps pusilla]|uniref:Mso1 N-terminal domain-containing protein n=1 Tax=Claviceps pusilla TaxID=123648 RepID=A0A9P7N662_9HYPO|nr:hypothetical protein E4U43_004165 [Claviceps pusilla]